MTRSRFVPGVAALLALAAVVRPVAGTGDDARTAIEHAIAARMGTDAGVDVVSIGDLHLTGPITSATIDPSARLGAPIPMLLFTGPATSVRVRVDVHVVVDHARAAVAIERGHIIAAADLAAARTEVFGVPLRHLPSATDLIGARALRPIVAGDLIQDGFVAAAPVVRAGATVTGLARVGDVEVSASFVASDGGQIGDVIRIVNPDTHRTLRARVLSSSLVEVVNVR